MRKYFSIILGSLLLSLVACSGSDDAFDPISNDPDYVVLSAKVLGVTRSEDTEAESTLAHIDVYVMDANYNVFHSERIKAAAPVAGQGQGQFVMKKKRQEFTEGAGYYVYMIANSKETTHPEARTWDDLLEFTQEDENMHLTGMYHGQDLDNVPTYFLMDGFAYLSTDASGKSAKTMSPIILNDGNTKNKIELSGTLYRAAAKFVLNITQGDDVEFMQTLNNATPALSFYQLPISTLVVTPEADARYTSTKQNTKEWGVDTNFVWVTDKDGKPNITIVGYAYANDWSKEQSINETAMLLSIPMMWDKNGLEGDGKEAASPVNWYKIPLSKESKFERNKCYVINVKINAIGAEGKNVPIELKDIEYQTLDWQDVKLTIGDYGARYLTLNTDLVKIYDKNFDLDQLTFASSSPIVSIKLKDVFSHNESRGNVYDAFTALEVTKESEDASTEVEYEEGDGVYAYYIDKFGQKIQLGTDPNFDIKISNEGYQNLTKEQILALENNLLQKYIRAEVPAEQKRALNGNIHIYSPINAEQSGTTSVDGLGVDDLNWDSHFNTVRYLEFEVMNEQGLTATFRVEQTPLTVISNIEGFYSYRDDHVLTDDPNEKPFDYFRYDPDFKSVMTSSMYLVHPHDFTNEPRPSEEVWARTPEMHLVRPEDFKGEPNEEYWNTPQQDRSYSWLKDAKGDYTWLFDPTNTCPAQGTDGETWVEIRYGFYANTIKYNNGTNSKTFQGIHRPRKEDRAYSDYFYRDMYRNLPGELAITNKNYKGTGLGPYYKAEVLDKDGNKQTRIFRDHYRWNAQPVFWSKFVNKYYHEAAQGPTYTDNNGRKNSAYKLKGQVDMYEYGPSENGGKTWGRHVYSTNLYKFSNHRMYKVFTTTTSKDYTLAYPRQTADGKTENTVNNSVMLSPTLVLASQLGETNYQQFLNNASYYDYIIPNIKEIYRVAERHCREYVETSFVDKPDANGVYNHMWDEGEEIIEYRDWRLPTKAEIEAIIEFQNSSRAMDKVLDAQYYFCITGTADSNDLTNIHNWVSRQIPDYDSATSQGYYIRCVRDEGRKTK